MLKAFNISLSCLAALVALSSVSTQSAEALPASEESTNAVSKVADATLNTAPENISTSSGAVASNNVDAPSAAPTAIADLINQQETTTNLQFNPSSELAIGNSTIDQLGENALNAELASVTSVSQLSDVKPTDWAFTSLQSLVERYGCIAGYPDRTFKGNKALSRYEFAAGLNACLDKINEIVSAGLSDKVSKEDLATLQKLQEEFAAELATLRGRVDALDKKVATLEAQQFSPTTKLSGLAWFNLTGATAGSPVTAETGNRARVARTNPNITFSYYLFLTLNTSFTGKDSLVTQLVTGNGSSPANRFVSDGFFNSWGTPITDQTGVPPGTANQFHIRELFYSFPLTDSVNVAIGPRINFFRYFDGNRFTNFLTGASSFNSSGSTLSNAVDRGSGAIVTWRLSPEFVWTTAYLAENTEFLNPTAIGNNTSSNPNVGLFAGTNTISTQLTYSPSRDANIRLLYTRSNIQPNQVGGQFVGGATGEPIPYGIVDDGLGGAVNVSTADTIIFNFDWLLSKNFGIFGRYSYGSTNVAPANPAVAGGNITAHSVQFGMAFPDIFKEGSLGVLSFVIPHMYGSGQNFFRSGSGDGATQYELELSYYYPISKNIAIVPAVYAIFNPNNFSTNPTVFVGNLRTQFSF
ncbi:MAG: iron uptake porin [Pseudanabaenaceae cyanobacterium bins.39]|nr:iron uptake porin [Pseudanabaenaceae cyanobacterium bins.39]